MNKVKVASKRIISVMLLVMLVVGSFSGTAMASETQVNMNQTADGVTDNVEDASLEELSTEIFLEGQSEDAITQEEEIEASYTVTLDANGGYFVNEYDDLLNQYIPSTEILTKLIPVGKTVTIFPVFQTDEQHAKSMSFAGWSLERDGELVSHGYADYKPVDNCILYAIWEIEEISENDVVVDLPKSEQLEEFFEEDISKDQQSIATSEEDYNTDAVFSANNINQTAPENINQEEQSINAIQEEFVRTDPALSIVESGTCGKNLTWTLDEDGTLTISGTGTMYSEEYKNYYFDKLPISKVVVEEGVSEITYGAFEDCAGLKKVVLPNSVKRLRDGAFWKCSSLTDIIIPDSVTYLGVSVFEDCSSLKDIIIPDSVTYIGPGSFKNCHSLCSVKLSDNMSEIREHSFANCLNLKRVIIPKSITSIYEGAFDNCPSDMVIYGKADSFVERYSIKEHINFIDPLNLKYAILSKIDNEEYTGLEHKPIPVISIDGVTIGDSDYVVTYSNNIKAGEATITITGVGDYEGTISKTFSIDKAAQSINVKASASSIDVGKTTKVTASGAKETSKYIFKSSNSAIATVNESGTVTGKAPGKVTIKVSTAATTNYKAASKSVEITVKKVLKKPGNCRFTKWSNSKYTGCRISWNKVDGAEGYQTLLSWTNGTHSSTTITKSNVLYRDCTVHPQHVSQMKVRAFYTSGGKRVYGPWSNVVYITPSPTKLTTKNASSGTNLKMNVSWNIVYGCNGYNVFITTNPNGKWNWYQSTSEKASATSASITKCGGSKLKKNTKYYVRIVTRRKRNGVFCTVPMPASNTYIGSFIIR